MASKSSPRMHSFLVYFLAATAFSALAVSTVVIYRTYLVDETNHQAVAPMQGSASSQAGESAPLHSGKVARADAVDSYEARLQKLEDRIIKTRDASVARSRQLEIWLGKTQNDYETRFERIEQRMVPGPTENDITATSNSLPDPDAHQPRLKELEMRMAQHRQAYDARLTELEKNLHQARETSNDLLKQLELRHAQSNDPYEERLRNVEQQLDRTVDEFRSRLEKIDNILTHTASHPDDLSAAIVAKAQYNDTVVAINEATAGNPPAAPPAKAPSVGHTVQPPLQTSGNPALEENSTAGQAVANELRNPLLPANSGNWAINLASYASRSIAARKMAEFLENGVQAYITQAIVRGKIMYRLQVAGFDSFAAAKTAAPSIRERLKLPDTWITRI